MCFVGVGRCMYNLICPYRNCGCLLGSTDVSWSTRLRWVHLKNHTDSKENRGRVRGSFLQAHSLNLLQSIFLYYVQITVFFYMYPTSHTPKVIFLCPPLRSGQSCIWNNGSAYSAWVSLVSQAVVWIDTMTKHHHLGPNPVTQILLSSLRRVHTMWCSLSGGRRWSRHPMRQHHRILCPEAKPHKFHRHTLPLL